MAIQIKFDSNHAIETPTLVLATRNGRKLGKLPAYDIVFQDSFVSFSEMQFKVLKSECPFWDNIDNFKLFYCVEFNQWYEMYVEIIDGDGTIKLIEGTSLGEAELSQIVLHDIQINTEDDIAREDYVPTVLYDDTNPNASLLDRILEKAPHYSVKHVDSTIAGIQRVFEFDDSSIYDAFSEIAKEIGCYFDIDCGTDSDNAITREINVYDLYSYCQDCGARFESQGNCEVCGSSNIIPGYGDNTQIYISTDNLADEIEYSTDTDAVKNCFQLVAGDDLMTATVINCNPNGSQYIWNITDEMKSDMSTSLVSKLEQYDNLYSYYQNDYAVTPTNSKRTAYNNLVSKYLSYRSDLTQIPASIKGYPNLMSYYYDTIDFELYLTSAFMPDTALQDTTASVQAALLTAAALSPVAVTNLASCSESTATNAVKAMAQAIIDPRYQVVATATGYSNGTWRGSFVVTNYSDDEDTATSSVISLAITDNYEEYLRQRINKALAKTVDDATDIVSIFSLGDSAFRNEMKKYCLNRLNAFYDACQAALNILIEQGIADKQTWANKNPDLYTTIYLPYYNKLGYIATEIQTRESEIAVIAGARDVNGDLISDGMQTDLMKKRNAINKALDFKKYLGDTLWKEFAAYRREDTYSNGNYISTGLNNAEIFSMAQEFISVARKELAKSSMQQHSISSTLKNLLVMPEFANIVNHFKVGNWLRASVDGKVYKLRLLDYKIDYSEPDEIPVTFSDVMNTGQSINDVGALLRNMSSLSSTYGAVAKQANNGSESKSVLDNWVSNGLSLTTMRIVDSSENQNITWDERGILLREYLPETESYDVRQLKIINRGLYATDDAWLTSKAAIGNFTFWNPSTKRIEDSYGVIADTLVGNFILGENVGIYNQGSTITLNKDGLNITNGTTTVAVNPNDSSGIVSITTGSTKRLWTDSSGTLHIRGDGSALDISSNSTITGINSSLKVNADAITAEVTRAGNAESNLSSSITQLAQSITLSVTNGSTSSTIQLSGNGITTQSHTISFSGLVKFSDLSTSGQTTINGSNITTGTIDVSRIKLAGEMDVYQSSGSNVLGGTLGYMSGKHRFSDGTEEDTNGMAISSEDGDHYVIVTDSGIRMTERYNGTTYNAYLADGIFRMNARLWVTQSGSLMTGDVYLNASYSSSSGYSYSGSTRCCNLYARGDVSRVNDNGTKLAAFRSFTYGGGLDVSNSSGSTRALLYVTSAGEAVLDLYDSSGATHSLTPALIDKLINL